LINASKRRLFFPRRFPSLTKVARKKWGKNNGFIPGFRINGIEAMMTGYCLDFIIAYIKSLGGNE
jgi:hypothetical protein